MADTATETKTATLTETMKFFGFANMAEFRKEWAEVTTADKKVLRDGIGNGTLTY